MTGKATAVLADVEMALIPAVRRDVCGKVPTAAAIVAHEDRPVGEPTREGRNCAGHHVLLVAMHDPRPPHLVEQRRGDRVRPLAAHVPCIPDHPYLETTP